MTKFLLLLTLIFVSFFFAKCDTNQNEIITVGKKNTKDSCCKKENLESSTKTSTESEITCPECGYKKIETLPTDICQIKYTCDSCTTVSYAKDGDCCVFCSYGTNKCPSKQED